MVACNDFPPCAVICDRLYSSCPLIADFQQKGLDFVIRTKQNNGALKPIQTLSMKEFDVDIQFVLTDSQSKGKRKKGISTSTQTVSVVRKTAQKLVCHASPICSPIFFCACE